MSGTDNQVSITFARSPDIEEIAEISTSIVGSLVFSLRRLAVDPDLTGQIINYALEPVNGDLIDGRNYFKITDDNSYIVLYQAIDVDEISSTGSTTFGLNISATDVGTPLPLTSFASLTITVLDADDQGPVFKYSRCHKINGYCTKPYYQAVVRCGYVGPLHLYPGPIHAEDRDTQNHSIIYNITNVTPKKFADKFEISRKTGEIVVVKPSCAFEATEILLTITATENSSLQNFERATIQIDLLANSANSLKNTANNEVVHSGRNHILFPHESQQVVETNYQRSSSLNLFPFITFLILFVAFTVVGAIVTYVWIRLSAARKKRKKSNVGKSNSKRVKESEKEASECPLCQSVRCTGHLDGITCFRTCSAKSNDAVLSDKGVNGKILPPHLDNHCTDSTTLTSQEGYRVSKTPMPHARKAVNSGAKNRSMCSSTSSSSSSHRSATGSQPRKTQSKSTSTRMPPAFVPTAITASNGYCRGGLYKGCGGNVELRPNPAMYGKGHDLPCHQGEEKLVLPSEFSLREGQVHSSPGTDNGGDNTSHNSKSKVSNGKDRKGKVNDKETARREDHSDESDQNNYEGRSLQWRLREKLSTILPPFLRFENQRVRFDDRNIWAFD
ncbi:hypothetical protein PoB_004874100 [Plakobranchus ocellatus]|uniref:Cadherin domain-containing protein n=1 Tax=Plakobranchus ocellatus TaxID=259542 RepID=A0AAV4BP53_9GAST|nr:hypothetical protein PoB_004874100 [Plakobranchus ocellatus]